MDFVRNPDALRFPDCHGLRRLRFFQLDEDGRIRLRPEFRTPIIDVHTHLAWNYSPVGEIDLWGKPPVEHFFPFHGARVDLNRYSFKDMSREALKSIRRDVAAAPFVHTRRARSHTIPNLLEEMDDTGVERAVVLNIELAAPSRNNERTLSQIKGEKRLIPFVSLHPLHGGAREKLERFASEGARGFKFHPVFQMIPPDHPRSLALFRLCAELGLPILSHSSSTGSEPKWMQNLSSLERFPKAIRAAEGVPFIIGHSGVNQFRMAVKFAREYDNVMLDLNGQPVNRLRWIFNQVDHDKLLFGSDWPFYPVILPLAKVLYATEGERELRRKILYENAKRLLTSDSID